MSSSNGTVSRHRNFEVAVAEASGEPVEAPSFTIAGETFQCMAELPGPVFTDLLVSASKGLEVRIEAAVEFIKGALDPADHERFDEVCRRKIPAVAATADAPARPARPAVTAGAIAEIASWMVEEYVARPTRPPGG